MTTKAEMRAQIEAAKAKFTGKIRQLQDQKTGNTQDHGTHYTRGGAQQVVKLSGGGYANQQKMFGGKNAKIRSSITYARVERKEWKRAKVNKAQRLERLTTL